jgi:hypothetical protein
MCVLIFSTIWSENFFYFYFKKNGVRYDQVRLVVFMNSTRHSCPILMKLEFSRQTFSFLKNTKISNFMNIRPVGAELFLADRRTNGQMDRWTDMTKSIVAFPNFPNTPKSRAT